ncbi:hypothetical protein E1301_Tti013504 [Triplophysa tibetana]|uniref:Ig-like domain-containing protein n=1 Tax=Triplophysa tibetana TaxID=1572043 RepID=A0A5A9NPJ9_9TELE|nr:hypothetical protein E1301_Tti013504 [Triplophysa tibetana]
MTISVLFLCFFVDGLFGVDADEVKSVSEMEGQNVTLYTDATDIQTADRIVWVFGTERMRIAQHNIAARKISIYEDVLDGKFRQRLMLDRHTGSLTITKIRTTDSGLYELQIVRGTDVISRSFSIIVSAHLPTPQITSDCPQNSSSSSVSKCVLLCSVMNVSHVTLSWYKGNSLLSSISVSDLKIRVSLPLEVEYQDTNTYRCVINNPIINHTQHLNITQHCHKCSVKWSGVSEEQDQTSYLTVVICVVSAFGVVAIVVAFCIYWKLRKTDENGQASEVVELNAMESCVGADETKTTTDGVKYITVKAGASFELHTGVKDIQKCDLIQWKFGEAAESTNPFVLISSMDKNRDISEKLRDGLKLNKKTGSITVENSRTTDTGVYKLEINSSTEQVLKCFFVTVSETTS